jgi:hypothetical protein
MDDEKRKFYPMELTYLLRGFNVYIKKTEKHKKTLGISWQLNYSRNQRF